MCSSAASCSMPPHRSTALARSRRPARASSALGGITPAVAPALIHHCIHTPLSINTVVCASRPWPWQPLGVLAEPGLVVD